MFLAQLTDKMDHKYIIASEPSGSHDDAHAKKNLPSWIFEKMAMAMAMAMAKSAVSQTT